MVASKVQRKVLTPVVKYFETKRNRREDQDVADRRFIRSVQELLRAEEQDQTQWAARRRRRLAAAAGASTIGNLPNSSMKGGTPVMRDAAVETPCAVERDGNLRSEGQQGVAVVRSEVRTGLPPKISERAKAERKDNNNNIAVAVISSARQCVRSGHQNRESDGRSVGGERREQHDRSHQHKHESPEIDLALAMTRVGKLRSAMAAAPPDEAHNIALEVALLYVALSDFKNALKNFSVACKRAPEAVPTKEEKQKEEVRHRKLMLLDDKSRAKALAASCAEEAEVRREKEKLEMLRRRRAATGVYQCLLHLKQPVAAAEAAKARLRMCDDNDKGVDPRHKVEMEIHEVLLRREGLIEAEATNQGAWLQESAGALPDLHASLLENLCSFPPTRSARTGSLHAADDVKLPKVEDQLSIRNHRLEVFIDGDGKTTVHDMSTGDAADGMEERGLVRARDLAKDDRDVRYGADGGKAEMGCGDEEASDGQDRRRSLRTLGRALARKRRFTASRQAFEAAIRGGPEEVRLRERQRCRSKGFYLNLALEEASPDMNMRLVSRWQGGVEADEIRRQHLPDHTGFTGAHRGAETLIADMPPGGWANDVSDLGYVDRISRARMAVASLSHEDKSDDNQAVARERGSVDSSCGCIPSGNKALLLGHRISAEDVVLDTTAGKHSSDNQECRKCTSTKSKATPAISDDRPRSRQESSRALFEVEDKT